MGFTWLFFIKVFIGITESDAPLTTENFTIAVEIEGVAFQPADRAARYKLLRFRRVQPVISHTFSFQGRSPKADSLLPGPVFYFISSIILSYRSMMFCDVS